MIGATLVGLGFFLSTFATHIWVLYFTFGVMVGTGSSFAFLPCIACLAQWFEKRRGLAVGIGTSCASFFSFLSSSRSFSFLFPQSLPLPFLVPYLLLFGLCSGNWIGVGQHVIAAAVGILNR